MSHLGAFFLHFLFRGYALELSEEEAVMTRSIKVLDSEMQTLVYDNYNKFISATDTIRKMKTDFHKMDDEMHQLSESWFERFFY